mgnify:CR=1 FL=1
MESLRISIFVLATVLIGCTESVEIELRQWNDPVNGSAQIMEQIELAPWQVNTFSEARDTAIIVKKDNGPMFSYDTTGKSQTIMVHPKPNSGHSSIDVTDTNNDGIFDRIHFFSGPDAESITMYEANLVKGLWVVNEHTRTGK